LCVCYGMLGDARDTRHLAAWQADTATHGREGVTRRDVGGTVWPKGGRRVSRRRCRETLSIRPLISDHYDHHPPN